MPKPHYDLKTRSDIISPTINQTSNSHKDNMPIT